MNNTKHKLNLGEALHAVTPHTEPGKLEMVPAQVPEILLQWHLLSRGQPF